MSNKTLSGLKIFNCRNIVSLDEHKRQQVGNRLVEDWISKYEHNVLEQERRIKEIVDSLEKRR